MAKFDVQAARKAGYTDAEIADYLAKEGKFNAANARQSGYSDGEIITYLTGGDKVAPPPPEPTFMEDVGSYARGIARGVAAGDPAALLARGGTYLTDVLGLTTGANEKINAALNAGENAQNKMYRGGKAVGEIGASIPAMSVGGGYLAAGGQRLAQVAPAAKPVARVVEQFGKSMKTGGIGVQKPSKYAPVARDAKKVLRVTAPVASSRAGRVALRVAGGAGAGAAGAAMMGSDVSEGTMIGAGFPLVANVGKHGLGYVYDKLLQRYDKVQAGAIIRNLIADKSSGILEALANAPKNVKANTAEFLAERGLLTPELAAATRIVSGGKASKPLEDVALARAAGQNAMRQQMMGADTQTGAVAGIKEAKKQVRVATEPQREAVLGRADIGRTQILPAERESARLAQLATDEVAQARQLLSGAENQTMRLGQMDDLGDVFDPQAINRQRGIIGGLERFGGEAADRSLVVGQDSRSAAQVAANLRAQGLAPLDISGVVNKLRQQAFNAANVSPTRASVFSAFADALERRAAQFDGYIDATGLHLARREMGQFVADTLKGSDPQTIRLGTSKLIGEAQPLIDDAIEAAGGKGWKDYLNTFSQGMRKAEQQDFGRKLAALPEARLNKVVRGDDPAFVEESFGPGRFDIDVEYPASDFPVARTLSGEIGAQRAVAQTGLEDLAPSQKLGLASGAQARVEDAMAPGTANFLTQGAARILGGFPGLYGGGQFASQAEQMLANKLRANTMRQLAPGLASPSQALRLSNMRPAYEYIDQGLGLAPNSLLSLFPRALQSYSDSLSVPTAEENRNRMRR
jgi:hypothetical protein